MQKVDSQSLCMALSFTVALKHSSWAEKLSEVIHSTLLCLQMDVNPAHNRKKVKFLLGTRNILACHRRNQALVCVWIHRASLTFVFEPMALHQGTQFCIKLS